MLVGGLKAKRRETMKNEKKCDHCGFESETLFNVNGLDDCNYCSDCQLAAECEESECVDNSDW